LAFGLLSTTVAFAQNTKKVTGKVTDENGNVEYQNSNFTVPFPPLPTSTNFSTWDFYQYNGTISIIGAPPSKRFVKIPLSSQINGNLKNNKYTITIKLYYNYDALTNTSSTSYILSQPNFNVETKQGNLLLIASNNSTVICYDIDGVIQNSLNNFIYFTPTQSFSDVRTITRQNLSREIFISGDNIYNFDLGYLLSPGTVSNTSTGPSDIHIEEYVNRILFRVSDDKTYLVGNNSYAKFLGTNSYIDLDPTFNSKLKSRLLFLDY
jgi:hypothetical protein